MPVERRADPDGGDRADDVLALAADVEQAGAEGERDGEADEDQRRRQQQRLLQVERRDRAVLAGDPREEPVQPAALEDRVVGLERVRARRAITTTPADEERHERGDQRDQHAAAAQVARQPRGDRRPRRAASPAGRSRGPRHGAAACPPVMATPSSSSVASGGSSADDPALVDHEHAVGQRRGSPRARARRAARRARRRAARAAAGGRTRSRRRPGRASAARRASTRGSSAISRAMTTFCWLPPESERGRHARAARRARRTRSSSGRARGSIRLGDSSPMRPARAGSRAARGSPPGRSPARGRAGGGPRRCARRPPRARRARPCR